LSSARNRALDPPRRPQRARHEIARSTGQHANRYRGVRERADDFHRRPIATQGKDRGEVLRALRGNERRVPLMRRDDDIVLGARREQRFARALLEQSSAPAPPGW